MPRSHSYRFTNGSIVTMDPDNPVAGEVITQGDRIVWVGNRGDAPTEYRRAREIDLNKRLLLPAFSDAHTHFVLHALGLQRVDLVGTSSLATGKARIKEHLKNEKSARGWVIGQGLDINLWKGKWPNRKDLDALIPDRPAAIWTHDHHSMWVNSEALKRAKITQDTPDPNDGEIVRDSHGEPTGILKESAYKPVWSKVPKPSDAEMKRATLYAQALAHEQGCVALGGDMGDTNTLRVFRALQSQNKLRMRLWKSVPVDKLDDAIALGLTSGLGDEWIKIGAVKIFLDGALGSRTAWMLKPYSSEPGNTGIPQYTDKEFRSILQRASKNGLSVCVHAIGDAACRQAIRIIGEYAGKFPKHQPPRIEHLQIIDKADLGRLARSGIVCSMQPCHLLTDRDYCDEHWGRRSHMAFAFRTLAEHGIPMAFGSDVPIEPLNPIEGIGAAVYRSRPEDKRGSWHKKERLTVWEAVHGFTAGAAYAAGESHRRGMIRPGQLADLVILDRNIFTIKPVEIFDAAVDLTMVGGEPVFDRSG
ncbi:MAG: amidohydrolase family protein [candidate division Zixibacteria bacterium]|nr:amidohydrolase family protein [candidate division Zixibacteria bacterium]